ncbi:hypothetical protein C8J56DRAFT_92377 [Mycena floridula]|nr:hypothetical protein C8J56DRAFT_92377 [Mycena floridula]
MKMAVLDSMKTQNPPPEPQALCQAIPQRHVSVSYQHITTLQGPKDIILSLTVSHDAKLVAAVGYDSVSVWDLSTNSLVATPAIPKHAFNVAQWLHFGITNCSVLLLASRSGDLLAWAWDADRKTFDRLFQVHSSTRDEILCMDVHRKVISTGQDGTVAIGAADRSIRVFTFSAAGAWNHVFSVLLQGQPCPSRLRFCKLTKDVFVFTKPGKEIIQLHHLTGAVLSRNEQSLQATSWAYIEESSEDFVAFSTGGSSQPVLTRGSDGRQFILAASPGMSQSQVLVFRKSSVTSKFNIVSAVLTRVALLRLWASLRTWISGISVRELFIWTHDIIIVIGIYSLLCWATRDMSVHWYPT